MWFSMIKKNNSYWQMAAGNWLSKLQDAPFIPNPRRLPRLWQHLQHGAILL
jgi:hypothetical protein